MANSKVLVVDDNPMVLALLEKALAPLASVSSARDATDALAKAMTDAPDLVIADYRMHTMDGAQLLRALKSQPATARIPVILAASRADLAERLQPVQDLVEDFLEKPFFLAEATARFKRVLHKIALEKMANEAPGGTRLRGSLAQMGVIDLLQSLEVGRKTCALELSHEAGGRCTLFFIDGQIRHAVCGSLTGDEAVYRALTWTDLAGSFQIDFSVSTTVQSTTRSTQGLLMEGLRLLDEANRDAG